LIDSQFLRGYENTGTCELPVWERNDGLVEGLPDQLERAAACLADLDGDGDLDYSAGDVFGDAYYYENVGSASVPVWEEHNEMYPYLGGYSFLNPELADLDADGDFELVLANATRFLQSYRNAGTPNDPIWEEDGSFCEGIEMPGGCADLSFADVDGDGDLDLIAGDRDAYWGLVAFENVGTEYAPVWLESTDLLIGVDTDVLSGAVDLADLNGDGAPDLWSCHVEGRTFYLNGDSTTLVNSTVTWSAIKALFR
jgi:hypothetical protein